MKIEEVIVLLKFYKQRNNKRFKDLKEFYKYAEEVYNEFSEDKKLIIEDRIFNKNSLVHTSVLTGKSIATISRVTKKFYTKVYAKCKINNYRV